jgi:carbon-monoxide dehydrogenase large subunit
MNAGTPLPRATPGDPGQTLRYSISLTVNGEPRNALAEPRRTLADFLRHDLGLTGTHLGCEQGVCGACTVLWDGEPVRSCLTFAVQVDGASLTTVEGLAPAETPLHPLQAAFKECHALQCGFCTSGILMTAAAFLGRNPAPSDETIREALSGNLCRCTGYENIVRAIRRASDVMHGTASTHTPRAGGLGGRPEPPISMIGAAVTRVEDERLLRGRGRYLDDLHLPGALAVAFLRSPHAHALISRVDAAAARQHPGVVAVLTADDLGPVNRALPQTVPHAALRGERQPPLASGKVLYVGQPVAAVVASDRYVAEDAVDLVRVEYEPLAASVGTSPAPAAPPVFAAAPDNVAARLRPEVGSVDRAMADADLRLTDRFVVRRGAGHAMEGRGVAAMVEADGSLTVWSSTQSPHTVQRGVAEMLGLPLGRVRVLAPDIGGGFGPKVYFYPEEVVVPFLARQLGRPVTWSEDRREHFLSSVHEGEQVHEVEIGVRKDGTLLALRDRFSCDIGADLPWGIVTPLLTLQALPGQYRLPSYACDLRVAYSNKVAVAPVRGAGRPQAAIVMERLIDRVARALELDPAEVRRRNFIQPHEFPYALGITGRDGKSLVYDSGDYPALLRRALELADYERFRKEQPALRAAGRRVGIGIGTCVESTSLGPFEGATVRVEPSGSVLLFLGSSSQGQGHATTMAQICADVLGVPFETITVTGGRTDTVPYGVGTFASRMGAVGGNAVAMAARATRQRALAAAAALLEASVDDLVLENARVHVRGVPARGIGLAEIAHQLSGPFPGLKFAVPTGVGLEATEYFQPPAPAYASSCHVAIVEVDPEVGSVVLKKHIVVHDCGRVVNPLIVDGQVHGGVAHGISDTFFEEMRWDAEGQPLATSYLDYLLPTAPGMPVLATDHVETPTPLNPLGMKGAGEGGTIACGAAISGAIEDALAPLGVLVREFPITPDRLHGWIVAAQSRHGAR